MSKLDINIQGKKPIMLSEDWVRRAIGSALKQTKYQSAEIGLAFVDEKKMSEMNKAYHGGKGATDILSFTYHEKKSGLMQGDLVICPKYVKAIMPPGTDQKTEYTRLLIHGILHLAGFDHAKDKEEKKMFKIQEDLVAKLCSR